MLVFPEVLKILANGIQSIMILLVTLLMIAHSPIVLTPLVPHMSTLLILTQELHAFLKQPMLNSLIMGLFNSQPD
jgi:hypothetical protein